MKPIFTDVELNIVGNTEAKRTAFQIAWLNRRVENLEAIVAALLSGPAREAMNEYLNGPLAKPGPDTASSSIKGRGKSIAASVPRKAG
jgi:hypothetical protein